MLRHLIKIFFLQNHLHSIALIFLYLQGKDCYVSPEVNGWTIHGFWCVDHLDLFQICEDLDVFMCYFHFNMAARLFSFLSCFMSRTNWWIVSLIKSKIKLFFPS